MSELSQGELNDFNDHLTSLADDAGFELDDDDRMRLFQLSQAGGFNPQATEAAFVDLYGDFEEDDDEPMTRADFEEWAAQQQPDEPDPQEGIQRLAAHTAADTQRLTAKIGRPLLEREQDAILERVLEQADRYDQIDVEAAASGVKSYSDMTRDEVNEAMTARARDLDPDSKQPDPDRLYDIHGSREDYVDYAVEKLQNGAEFTDVYSEPDPFDEAA